MRRGGPTPWTMKTVAGLDGLSVYTVELGDCLGVLGELGG